MPDEPDALTGAVDPAGPWTIKVVSPETRRKVTDAARREGQTVGQWLERRVAKGEGQESPIPVGQTTSETRADLVGLDKAVSQITQLAAAGVPIPKGQAARLVAAVLDAQAIAKPPDGLAAARQARLEKAGSQAQLEGGYTPSRPGAKPHTELGVRPRD